MNYLRTTPAYPDPCSSAAESDAVVIYSETDDKGFETRKAARFSDGTFGFADARESTGTVWLEAKPPAREKRTESAPAPIAQNEFERVWKRAVASYRSQFRKHTAPLLTESLRRMIGALDFHIEPKTSSWPRNLWKTLSRRLGGDSAGDRHRNTTRSRHYARSIGMMMRRVREERQIAPLRRMIACGMPFQYYPTLFWRKEAPERIENDIADPHDRFAVFALGCFHPNGYFREQCLLRLEPAGPAALPFVLPLVNNWVRVVADTAADIAERLLRQATTEQLLGSLAFLETLRGGGRRDDAALQSLLRTATAGIIGGRKRVTPEMLAGLEPLARRCAYALAVEQRFFDAAGEITLLEKERDLFSRLLLAKGLLTRPPVAPELERFLLNNNSPSLRLLALRNRFDRDGGDGMDWEPFLGDPYKPVRGLAQYAVGGRDRSGLANRYRKLMAEHPGIGVVCGLGETGDASDIPLLEATFASSASPVMRRAALSALVALDGGQYDDLLLSCLDDRSMGKCAFSHIRRLNIKYPCGVLYEKFHTATEPHVKQRFLALLADAGSWDRLPWLLRLRADAETREAWNPDRLLDAWEGGYVKASPQQREAIMLAMEEYPPPTRLLAQLKHALKNPNFGG